MLLNGACLFSLVLDGLQAPSTQNASKSTGPGAYRDQVCQECYHLSPVSPAASRSWHFVVLPRHELRHRCPLLIDFFLGSAPRPRRGCSSWLYLALLAPALCWGCVKVRVLWARSSLRPYGLWPPGSLPHPTSAHLSPFPHCCNGGWKVLFRAGMLRGCTPES